MALTISHRCQNIAPSPTLAIDARAKEMKAAGVDVIGFGAGVPGFAVAAGAVFCASCWRETDNTSIRRQIVSL